MVNKGKTMCIFHDWAKWGKPFRASFQTYDAPPALVTNQELKTYSCDIQDRTCNRCGKYQWRKV